MFDKSGIRGFQGWSAYRVARRSICFAAFLGLSASGFAQTPPLNLDWQPRQDDRYVVEASYSGLAKVSGTDAEAGLGLRLQWWGLMGQPVETYAMKWGVSKALAKEGELLEPFAERLPNNGDFSGNPEIVAEFAKLRSTDIGLRIEFYIRAPKDAIKGESFFGNCDARYCYARGIRDLGRLDLPLGRINKWNSELSPKTPIDYKMADWQAGCRVAVVECQRNTLQAGTAMAISKMDIWKLTYDHSTAKSIVAKWAAAAQDDSPQVAQFRASLQELVQPFQARSSDPETRASNAYVYYGKQLTKANKLSPQANALDKAVWDSGNRSGERKYARELSEAERKIGLLQKQASQELARARAGTNLTDAQIAELKRLEQAYARKELAVSKMDGPVTASDKAGLQRTRAQKQTALNNARGELKSTADQIDAKKRAWGAYDEEASHSRRASDLASSLQRDIALIDGKLAGMDQNEKKRLAKNQSNEARRSPKPTISSSPKPSEASSQRKEYLKNVAWMTNDTVNVQYFDKTDKKLKMHRRFEVEGSRVFGSCSYRTIRRGRGFTQQVEWVVYTKSVHYQIENGDPIPEDVDYVLLSYRGPLGTGQSGKDVLNPFDSNNRSCSSRTSQAIDEERKRLEGLGKDVAFILPQPTR